MRGFAAALAVLALALPFAGGLEWPAVALVSLALTGLVFAAVGVITGVWAETFDQHSFIASIVITPTRARRRGLLLGAHARRAVADADPLRPDLLPRRRDQSRLDRLSRVFRWAVARYGPRPNEICQLIEEWVIPTIYGNYDYAIARDDEDCGCFYPNPKDREIGQGSVAWTLKHTDERAKRFMRDLLFDLRFELAGKRVRLVHGSPRKVNEYLLEDRAASTFERIAGLADCDVLLFGHTHKPWVREYGGVLLICRDFYGSDGTEPATSGVTGPRSHLVI